MTYTCLHIVLVFLGRLQPHMEFCHGFLNVLEGSNFVSPPKEFIQILSTLCSSDVTFEFHTIAMFIIVHLQK
jgi:hypothetical protein